MTFAAEFYLVAPDFLAGHERDAIRLTLACGRGVGLYGFAHGGKVQWAPAAHGLLAVVDGAALPKYARDVLADRARSGWCARFCGLDGATMEQDGAHRLVVTRDGEQLLDLSTSDGALYLTPAAARALRTGPAAEVWPAVLSGGSAARA